MRSRFPFAAFGALLVFAALTGCAQQRFEKLFGESVARPALSCFHPAGQFVSADGVQAEGNGAFTGIIHWRGQVLGNEYVTRVRVALADGSAHVTVVDDTAVTKGVRDSCDIPVPR